MTAFVIPPGDAAVYGILIAAVLLWILLVSS